LALPADVGRFPDLIRFLMLSVPPDIPEEAASRLELVAEEAFVNIARHAYPSGNGDVEITVRTADGRAVIVFSDSGVPFDPMSAPDPDIDSDTADRPIGGLGIHLMRKNTEKIEYVRRDGRNVLTVTVGLRRHFDGFPMGLRGPRSDVRTRHSW